MRPWPRVALTALGLTLLGAPGSFALESWSVAVDSTAFGTVELGTQTRAEMGSWWWSVDLRGRVPVFLMAKGGGLDTGAVEAGAAAGWSPAGPWDLRLRGDTGVNRQSQVLGTFTAWTLGLALEPAARWTWGQAWVRLGVRVTVATSIELSDYVAATFDERYEGAASQGPRWICLAWSAARFSVGAGFEGEVLHGWFLGLEAGLSPPPGPLGWMDGFSFGEIPFSARVSSRWAWGP